MSPKQRQAIAARAGLSDRYLYQCLTGRRTPSRAALNRIMAEARHLGLIEEVMRALDICPCCGQIRR